MRCLGTMSLDMLAELNNSGSFNFNIHEAYQILQEHSDRDHNVSGPARVVLVCVYGLLMVAGLTANLLVSVVVARRPQMHTPRNLYIVNLTVSDMTLCLVCMPFTLVSVLGRQWSLGLALCKLVPLVQCTNIMVSVGTITVIALDRYVTIVRGQQVTNNRRRVVTFISLVWLVAVAAALPVAFFQVVESVRFQRVVLYEVCLERWPAQWLKVMYGACVLLVQAVIPALVLCLVHARIASYLHAHARTHQDLRRAQREIQRNRRTTLLLSGVAVLFTVSWLPLGVFSLSVDILYSAESAPLLTSQELYVTLAACHATAMSSAVSNPVVYGWLNSNIRQEFLQLLPSKCGTTSPGRGKSAGDDGTTRTALQTATPRRDSVILMLQDNDLSLKPSTHPRNAVTAL